MQDIDILVCGITAQAIKSTLNKQGKPWATLHWGLSENQYMAYRTGFEKRLKLWGLSYLGQHGAIDTQCKALFVVFSTLDPAEIANIHKDVAEALSWHPKVPVFFIYDNPAGLSEAQQSQIKEIAVARNIQHRVEININSQKNNYKELDIAVFQELEFKKEINAELASDEKIRVHRYFSCAPQYKRIGLFAGTGSVALIGLGIMGVMNLTSFVIGAILISAAIAALCLVLYKTDCWATHTVRPVKPE